MTDREKIKNDYEDPKQEEQGVNPKDQGFVTDCSAGQGIEVVYHLIPSR